MASCSPEFGQVGWLAERLLDRPAFFAIGLVRGGRISAGCGFAVGVARRSRLMRRLEVGSVAELIQTIERAATISASSE